MASYVLDTNVVAALMRGEGEAEERLLHQRPNEVYLVQPVIAEVEYGLARKRLGQRIADFDVAIAAHAIALDATLATRNIAHFKRVPRLECQTW